MLCTHLHSRETYLDWSSNRPVPLAHTFLMTFFFQNVQLLDLSSEDNPSIDVQNNRLVISAQRGSERIQITAPISGLLPSAVVRTQVKNQATNKTQKTPLRFKFNPRKGATLPASHKAVGENNPLSKMNEESVRELRAMAADPDYQKEFKSRQAMIVDLGKTYNIHWTTVYNIINNKSWKHIID